MTDKEYINNIKTISTVDLLNNLEDYGYDNYYRDLYRATMRELKERFCWHSVKDNILPPVNTHVRCVLNWCDVLYYATGWYNDKGCWDYTDNMNGDAELIAWAYLPEYKK